MADLGAFPGHLTVPERPLSPVKWLKIVSQEIALFLLNVQPLYLIC